MTLAAKAEAAVVLAAVSFINIGLKCQQVPAAWGLNSVPVSLSILRCIPYMVLSALHGLSRPSPPSALIKYESC